MRAERLVPAGLVLGEGPVALGVDGFACVDIRAGAIFVGDLHGGFRRISSFDTTVSAVAVADDDRLVVACGMTLCNDVDHRSIDIPGSPGKVRLNDGKVDPSGRVVIGTMADPVEPGAGALWSVDHGRATCLLADVTISNGLCWSADGETLYYIDTPTQRIDALDYDLMTGSVSNRRPVVHIDEALGGPDGMCIDSEGGLWVALWGGSAVHRYVDGVLEGVLEVPTPYVTCPVFVGAGLDTLVVTTASEPNPGAPGAGDLYVASPGIAGCSAHRTTLDRIFESG